jgi:diguanylate cyclase (GGDEF)-like protein
MQRYAPWAISRGVSALPKSARAVVRTRLHRRATTRAGDGGLTFALRLLLGFLVTLGLVEFVGFTIIDRNARSSQVAQYAAMQRSDVRIFESISRHSLTTASALVKIDSVLAVLGKRPGTLEAQLFDENGVIVAADDHRAIGTRDTDPRVAKVARNRRAYAGHEADPNLDPRDFEFIAPVELARTRYAYETTYDHASLDAELASVRRALLEVGGAGLIVGVALFYLLGGRTVIRRHRSALARATRDGMTDLPNQRAFYDELPQAIASAERYDKLLALVVFDIDDFKFQNDRYGHPHGDAVIKRVAQILSDRRPGDRAYRVGGDEFAAILPHADGLTANEVAEQLVDAVAETSVATAAGRVTATVSIGVAAIAGDALTTPEALLAAADEAMYAAKRAGRNRVASAPYERVSTSPAPSTS